MEIQERLSKYLDEIEKAVSTAAEFSAEQAPQVVQEFLAWEFWCGVIYAVAAIAAAVAMLSCLWSLRRLMKSHLFNIGSPFCPILDMCVVSAVVTSIALSAVAGKYAIQAVKVSIAPRVVLLEKVAEMVKK